MRFDSVNSDSSDINDDFIEARLVEGGVNAVFEGPMPEATGCPTIPGMKTRRLIGEEAKKFMKYIVPRRCSKRQEAIVWYGECSCRSCLQQPILFQLPSKLSEGLG